jgi:hypothetical protein
MTMKEWAELVSTLGFPVALCIVYVYDSRKSRAQLEASREALEKRIQALETESRTTLTGVISKNTAAMVSLDITLRGRPCLIQEAQPLGR